MGFEGYFETSLYCLHIFFFLNQILQLLEYYEMLLQFWNEIYITLTTHNQTMSFLFRSIHPFDLKKKKALNISNRQKIRFVSSQHNSLMFLDVQFLYAPFECIGKGHNMYPCPYLLSVLTLMLCTSYGKSSNSYFSGYVMHTISYFIGNGNNLLYSSLHLGITFISHCDGFIIIFII